MRVTFVKGKYAAHVLITGRRKHPKRAPVPRNRYYALQDLHSRGLGNRAHSGWVAFPGSHQDKGLHFTNIFYTHPALVGSSSVKRIFCVESVGQGRRREKRNSFAQTVRSSPMPPFSGACGNAPLPKPHRLLFFDKLCSCHSCVTFRDY